MKVANNVLSLIGKTPLVQLNSITRDLKAVIYAKLEFFNPGSSVKDRIALSMIEDAEQKGKINKDTVVIEPTSGNTGIGLAMVCSVKRYRLIITMPESMSLERRKILLSFGAELILTPASAGMRGAIEKAESLSKEIPNSYIPYQFKNKANPQTHRLNTGIEIWNDTDGTIDAFVAGVGTGGTITGVSEALKEKKPGIYCVAVEPEDSAVLSGNSPGSHIIQGIGAGFIPEILNRDIINEVITVSNNDALVMANRLIREEGILAGISSGANVFAAAKLASRPDFSGKTIVTVICDTGERYLSTPLFGD